MSMSMSMSMNSEDWLHEEIYVGVLDTLPRKTILWNFAKYGLEPFLNSYGYVLNGNASQVSSDIAALLYYNRESTLLGPYVYGVNVQNDYSVEHRQHYNHIVDSKAWAKFWEDWSVWDDVSLDSPYGFYRRLDIEEYAWSQINLDISLQTEIVEAHLEGYGYDEIYRDRDRDRDKDEHDEY